MIKNKRPGIRLMVAGAAVVAAIAGSALTAAPASAESFLGTMGTGHTLHAGEFVVSNGGGQYRLQMQSDGNLVEYGNGQALWSSETGDHPGSTLTMQGDGNAVVYDSNGKPLWSAGTNVAGGSSGEVGLGSDGNLWVKHGYTVVWQNKAPRTNTIGGREASLVPGWYLHSGAAELVMQSDGNLVSYVNGKAVWSTQTAGRGVLARVTAAGALVMYSTTDDGDLKTVWTTPTAGPGALLQLGMDGRLTLFRRTTIVWQS